MGLTVPQVDFILGAYAISNPEAGRKIRPDLFESETDKVQKEVSYLSTLPEDTITKLFGLDNPDIKNILEKGKQ